MYTEPESEPQIEAERATFRVISRGVFVPASLTDFGDASELSFSCCFWERDRLFGLLTAVSRAGDKISKIGYHQSVAETFLYQTRKFQKIS